MNTRQIVFSLILLFGYALQMTLVMAAESDTELPAAVVTSNNKQQVDNVKQPELVADEKQKNTELKQKKRSIKLIVGGHSEDGLAKQVILPVED